jgi:hypothetical protein
MPTIIINVDEFYQEVVIHEIKRVMGYNRSDKIMQKKFITDLSVYMVCRWKIPNFLIELILKSQKRKKVRITKSFIYLFIYFT